MTHHSWSIARAIAALGCLFTTACHTPDANAPGGNTGQVVTGGPIYVANCSKCHGALGQGTKDGPKVVGKGALSLDPPSEAQLRKTPFRTAKDVYDFIRQAMPKDKPGSLSEDDYAAILVFDLKANGIDLHHERINATNAGDIELHPAQ